MRTNTKNKNVACCRIDSPHAVASHLAADHLYRFSSRRHVPSGSGSLVGSPPSPLAAPLPLVPPLLRLSCQAGCCTTSLHAVASPASASASHRAVASRSAALAPLVRLVDALPLLTPLRPLPQRLRLSSHHCLSFLRSCASIDRRKTVRNYVFFLHPVTSDPWTATKKKVPFLGWERYVFMFLCYLEAAARRELAGTPAHAPSIFLFESSGFRWVSAERESDKSCLDLPRATFTTLVISTASSLPSKPSHPLVASFHRNKKQP